METEKKPAHNATHSVAGGEEEKKGEKVETEKNETASCCENEKCCEDFKCVCEKYKKFMPKIISGLLLVVIVGGFGYYKLVWRKNNLTASQARTKTESFINNSLIQPGTKVEIGEAIKENGMFKMKITIGEGEQKQEVDAYLSMDGKKFIPSLMDVAEVEEKIAQEKKKEEEAEKEIPKAEKPKVDLYVMSFCPFGNKAEDTMKPVYELLKNKADFNFHYIVNAEDGKIQSLHGEKEVVQNEREACVLKYFGKDKWFSFVTYVNKNCGNDGNCWEKGATEAGLNSAKIANCAKVEGLTLMKADAKISAEASASGSPTMIINGKQTKVVYKYGNSDAYKQTICEAFNVAPEECTKTLEANAETTEGGSCGTPPAK